MSAAPVVDEVLAKLLAEMPDPQEPLMADQGHAIWHQTLMGAKSGPEAAGVDLFKRGRLAQLECRHFKVTRAVQKTGCPRCGEMIRAGWDYNGFRNGDQPDDFSWPDDPLRALHEHVSS